MRPVAHVQVVRPEQLAARFIDTTRLVRVDASGRLPYDHVEIIALAVEHVRSHYAREPDPDRRGDEFTLRELRLAHEAIAGRPLQRDTFRRAMEPHLLATGKTAIGTRGRPAEMFRRQTSAEPTRRRKL